MKSTITFFVVALIPLGVFCQNSPGYLIKPGFEDLWQEPPDPSPGGGNSPQYICEKCETYWGNPYELVDRQKWFDYYESREGWKAPEPKFGIAQKVSSSDIFCPCCATSAGVYGTLEGNVMGRTIGGGNSYKEWLQGEMSGNGISSGGYYLVTVRVNATNNSNQVVLEKFGLRFIDKDSKMLGASNGYKLSNVKNEAHINIGHIRARQEWVWKSSYFKSDKNYDKIILGPFGSNQTLLWDDIRITDNCKDVRKFENLVFFDEEMLYQAEDKIIAGSNVDSRIDNGNVEVASNSRVIFKAPQVVLKPGFSTSPNGSFTKITAEDCQSDYIGCPDFPNLPSLVSSCNGDETEIGIKGYSKTGVSFEWSPNDHLDNPNSPNPTFDPPSGEGSITYDVTISNLCGEDSDQQVVVHYDDNPNPNPSLNITNVTKNDYSVSFDATINSDAKYVKVEVPAIGYSETYYTQGIDFSCCSFSWSKFFESCNASVCNDLDIIVSTKNFCSENIVSETIYWNRNSNLNVQQPLPNVISPNSDGVNDDLTFNVNGIDNWHIQVFNRWGNKIFESSGCVKNNPIIAWSPPCDQNFSEGTYTYVLEVSNNCGQSNNYSRNLTILNSGGCKSLSGAKDSTKTKKMKNEKGNATKEFTYSVIPNPSQGRFLLSLSQTGPNTQVSVFNSQGILVESKSSLKSKEVHFDFSNQASGMHLIKIKYKGDFYTEKIMIK